MSKKILSSVLLIFFVVSTQVSAWPFGKKAHVDPFSADPSKLQKVIHYEDRSLDERFDPKLSPEKRLELVNQLMSVQQEYANDSTGNVLTENPVRLAKMTGELNNISLSSESPEKLEREYDILRARYAHNTAQLSPYLVKPSKKESVSQDQIVDAQIEGFLTRPKTLEELRVIESIQRSLKIDAPLRYALENRLVSSLMAKESKGHSRGSDSDNARHSDASVPVRLHLPRAARVGFAPVPKRDSRHSGAAVLTHNPLAGAGGAGRGPSETVAAVRPSTRRSLRK